jgi:predicted AlkP superfamily pyrophosphatase or phosphodiesterase
VKFTSNSFIRRTTIFYIATSMKYRFPLSSWTIAILLLCRPQIYAQHEETVLLVSFDGFRNDYVERYNLPNFKAFAAAGTSAEGIVPCFPSLTFPNHYSIVTGLYPGHHGLVDNNFYDSALDIQYAIRNREAVEDARFYGGTPLWTLASRSGIQSASFFWVGSEVKDRSHGPDQFFIYDVNVPFRTRIDSVVAWLKLPAMKRPRMITLYFSEPDHTSHTSGPNAPATQQKLLQMDSLLGQLMKGIAETKVPVNTILVSDHGMSELTVNDETFTFLDEIYDVNSTKVRTVVSSTLAHLYADDPTVVDSMYQLLKAHEGKYKVYRKADLPKAWHYQHYRVGDLLLVSEPYHYIRHSDRGAFKRSAPQGGKFGVHGYDPARVKDMYGLFMAQGPQIKKGKKLGLVRNIDVYPLIARILNLPLPKIDGDEKALRDVYVKPK